jgi:O-antigen ligase
MQVSYDKRTLTGIAAAAATITAFAKTFVPFFLIGSTAIFSGTSALGIALIAANWRQLRNDLVQIPDVLGALALLYGVVVVNFLHYSLPAVPITHLVGILIFHGMFLVFGFAAARALRAVMLVIVIAAAIYLFIILQHTVRFGDIMRGNRINDIFGVGIPILYNTFHQNIGLVLGMGTLAAFGLASNRLTLTLTSAAVPILLIFLFHIAARTALVALVSSFLFLALGACWVRSKKAAILAIAAVLTVTTIASGIFYHYGMHDRDVDPVAPDAISRTIRELQDSDPEFRMQIWSRTLHRIVSEPDRLPFGRGVGMFPVDDGFGAPDWPLHAVEGSKHYPHNTYLEMLYETGIAGLLPFAFLTLFPLVASLRRWQSLSHVEKSALSIYVFDFVNAQFSGAFGRSNMEQFFLALAIGVIALKRATETRTPSLSVPEGEFDPGYSA